MRITLARFALLVATAALSGCGTMQNLNGHEIWWGPSERPVVPFGGIGNDARWMARGLPPNEIGAVCIVVAAVDMPLSLAAGYRFMRLVALLRAAGRTANCGRAG